MTYHEDVNAASDRRPSPDRGYGSIESDVAVRYAASGSDKSASGSGHVVMVGSYRQEFKETVVMAIPIVLTTLFQNMQGTIAIIFCGHLGDKLSLDGAALAVSMINVTCLAVAVGMGTACDTFFSQTFGSSRDVESTIYGSQYKKRVGVYLQRSLLVFTLAIMVVLTVHLNLELLLVLLGQDPDVARLTGNYLLIFIPGSVSFFWYVVLSKYVLNQSRTVPMVLVGVTSNVVNIALHYVLMFVIPLGVTGSAISQTVAYFTSFSLTVLYIVCSGMYKLTWDGWTLDCLRDWAPFVKLSLAGMIMVCVEWWAFEIGVFLCGILGQTELGAQSVIMQLDNIYYQIPLGMQTTCCIRTGQYLGAGDAAGAKRTSRVALILVVAMSLVFAILFTVFRIQLPLLLTNVPDVASLTSALLPLVAAYVFFDSISGVCKGVLHGSGRQYLGAIILVISYYFVVFPIAAPLMFLTNLGSFGYWWPMAGSLVVQSFILLSIVIFTNWQHQVEKARRRTGEIAEKQKQIREEQEENKALIPKPEGPPDSRKRRRSRILSASLSTTEIRALTQQAEEAPRRSILLRRGLVAAIFTTFLFAGVLVRLLVDIPTFADSADQLMPCVPYEQSLTYNGSLPVCNMTSSASPTMTQPMTS